MNLTVFVLGGVILIGAGILQLFVRPPPSERRQRGVGFDGAVVRMVLFVVMGALAVLVGLGVIPLARLSF
jgi:hypothetical protein